MKKNKKTKNKLIKYNNVKKIFNYFINNRLESLKKVFNTILKFAKDNNYFCIFVIINLANSIALRATTIGINSLFLFSPFILDLTILLILGAIGYIMNPKKQIIYYIIISFILTLICTINSSYYTYYTSFTSISLISTTKFIFAVGDAVVENVIKFQDLLYPSLYILLIIIFIKFSKEKIKSQKNTKFSLKILKYSCITFLMFLVTLTGKDIDYLFRQWNREYIVNKYGIYAYHINDFIKSIEPKISSLYAYDESLKKFKEYFEENPKEEKINDYTNKYEGMNIIGIHAESIQNFVIGLKIDGKEVTPNLNKLANSGLYFNNFYAQVSVGTSSDTEFTLATSLMPSNTGTAFGNYFNNTYISLPNLLKEKGYYTFSMHGNNADYWNRRIMHETLGYEHFYAKSEFEINETIGLGLSDSSFFKQAVEKLKIINSEHSKYYGTFIMLTNHTPFSEIDKYDKFDVSKTINGVKYNYMEGTKLGNYLKSVHYADRCLGEFLNSLEKNKLLDNTVIVLYGDHDARLPIEDYRKLYNYDPATDDILSEKDPNYIPFDDYNYELNRKVPLIIWSKKQQPQKISTAMGMYDVMPTLSNMLGISNKYALGHDIFNHLDDNLVVFPTGNWLTNKVYYNSQKSEYLVLQESIINDEYIDKNDQRANNILSVSNAIIVYDLIKNNSKENVDESKVISAN